MPKSANQKLKLLYMMQYLLERSDEDHPLSREQIQDMLISHDITVERKSFYSDIEALRTFGLDIINVKGKTPGYYIASRDFEVPELKLLVDSVQSSQFITEKKTRELIKKLETLCSAYEAQLIRRHVYVRNRIKHMNESIYYNVDKIHAGIATDQKICFKYFEFTADKKREYRHDGKLYSVSPYALTWDNENYYLIAFDTEAGFIKHYRVDRMTDISLTDESRDGADIFRQHDMGVYTRQAFSMFGGASETVEIEFDNHLAGVVLDRFGKDVVMLKTDEQHFKIRAEVMVSPQFFAWVFGLETGARIVGPDSVVAGMLEQLDAVRKTYESN